MSNYNYQNSKKWDHEFFSNMNFNRYNSYLFRFAFPRHAEWINSAERPDEESKNMKWHVQPT